MNRHKTELNPYLITHSEHFQSQRLNASDTKSSDLLTNYALGNPSDPVENSLAKPVEVMGAIYSDRNRYLVENQKRPVVTLDGYTLLFFQRR